MSHAKENEYLRITRDGLWNNNIVFAQILGMCPTMAVTGSATNGLGMGLATTAVLVAGLWLLLARTRLGLALRAVAENEDAARLMAINVPRTVMLASLISGVLAGAAGVLIGLNQNAIQPYMGETMMLRGFAVIIIGGLGDVRGAVAAGLLLGVAEVMAAGYIDSMVKDGVAFTLMVLVLWLKPAGLLGRARVSRA